VLTSIQNYRQITPKLATSGQPDEAELKAIMAADYEVVINIALHDAWYSLPDEPGTVRALGMQYIHIPVQFDAPTHYNLHRFFDVMDENRTSKIWVHCAANKRVSVFLGLYWHIRRGQPLAQAFALQREIWEPDKVWSKFITESLASVQT
jgi:protein tyrosine phosphatase (PTP) superfamily phosphohydrolase (DUF442 family)